MATLASLGGLMATPLTSAAPLLQSLQPSPLMPVLFVGHGSPMNAIENNHWRQAWQAMGQELLQREAKPQLILCISAHWLTRGGWYLTGMAQPKTIHDFGGFPQALFDQQYPAPGAPAVARTLAASLKPPQGQALGVDEGEWGLDHGSWSVLKPMFPQANIPVLQLSMDYSRPPAEHFRLGQALQALRRRGVLIVGSGNVVHNLRAIRPQTADGEAYDWAREFDTRIHELLRKGQHDALASFQALGDLARLAHPSHDHFLPLLYAAGAVQPGEMPRFFNMGFQAASISMQSVLWG